MSNSKSSSESEGTGGGKPKALTAVAAARSLAAALTLILVAALVWAQPPLTPMEPTPGPLSGVVVPEPANLVRFVKDKDAAIRLGKALFWDMQLGSDGITACASCHFHAGNDNRVRNQVNPAFLAGDEAFDIVPGPDSVLAFDDFPFFKLEDPENRFSLVLRNVNDVTSSQGVVMRLFQGINEGLDVDSGRIIRDPVFSRDGRNVRQVEPRATPTVINSVFNFTQFWDGRANHFFNGVNPFGIMDVDAHVWIDDGVLRPLNLTENRADNEFLLNNASLASQAVGPPLDNLEMSWLGRSWPDIGRKMLSLRPLAKQEVHPQDSSLAGLRDASGHGLDTTYTAMIQAAFQDEFWNSHEIVVFSDREKAMVGPSRDDPRSFLLSPGRGEAQSGTHLLQNGGNDGAYSQMEANFSLFFGLAVQLYQATLVSDQTPFDQGLLTPRQERGLEILLSVEAGCAACHFGSEFTTATVSARGTGDEELVELMPMADLEFANYDGGFYNIGVRPVDEDRGRGGVRPGLLDLAGNPLPLSFTRQFFLARDGLLPFEPMGEPVCVDDPDAVPPLICPDPFSVDRVAVDGAVKTPGLRNIELTGPYMRNGGMVTLMQTVDFYVRGGDFHEANIENLHPNIFDIDFMKGLSGQSEREALVDFLLALTDERVRWEMAPFDHPQLFVPHGHETVIPGNPKRTRTLQDVMIEIPAVGAAGRQAEGLPPLKPFMADDLEGADLSNFHFQR